MKFLGRVSSRPVQDPYLAKLCKMCDRKLVSCVLPEQKATDRVVTTPDKTFDVIWLKLYLFVSATGTFLLVSSLDACTAVDFVASLPVAQSHIAMV